MTQPNHNIERPPKIQRTVVGEIDIIQGVQQLLKAHCTLIKEGRPKERIIDYWETVAAIATQELGEAIRNAPPERRKVKRV